MSSTVTSSVGATLIRVPAGTFTMGSPENEVGRRYHETQRQVTLPHDFYLGETPVTQRQYAAISGDNPTDFPDVGEDAAVDSVRWEDAAKFCRLLTKVDHKAGVLSADWEYRLPTESEWEYACRAGNQAERYGIVSPSRVAS